LNRSLYCSGMLAAIITLLLITNFSPSTEIAG
jgi:hypothetical protein